MTMRRIQVLPLAAVVVVLTACGTRIPRSEVIASVNQAAGQPGSDGDAAATTGGGTLPGGAPAPGSAPGLPLPSTATGGGGTAAPGGQTARPDATNTAVAGGNRTPFVIGQVGTFSGLAGGVFASAQPGLQVWVKSINARGGLAGHPVVLYSQDDQANPSRTGAIARDMIQNKKIQAFVAAQVPLTVNGLAQVADPAKVPVIGGDVGSDTWYSDPNFYPNASSPFDAGGTVVRYLVTTQHKTKYGVIYCIEANGCTRAKQAAVDDGGVERAGGTVVYQSQTSLGTTDFTQQCLAARRAGAEMLAVYADGATMGRVATSCAQQGYKPVLLNGSSAVAAETADRPELDGLTVFDTQFPWTSSTTPAEQEYQKALKDYAPGLRSSPASASAWSTGKLLETVVAKLGTKATDGPLTTALIQQGLWEIKGETLGGLFPGKLTFNKGKPASPAPCAYIMMIKAGAWTPPVGEKLFCEPLRPGR
jgi:branched-chain amino acid transport system substrate-binding protein